jgi:mannosyltransferase
MEAQQADDASGGGPGRPWRQAASLAGRAFWCWPPLTVACLGLYQVRRPELWRDELASWNFATRSVPGLMATAQHTDAAQVPYYLVLHFWIAAFGSSVLVMRGLSVLAMAGAAAFTALAARDLAGRRAGVAAGLVLAVVPSVSRFAQEVRFYALGMLVAALATWLLVRALARPSWARWAGYGVTVAALGYLNTVGLALLAGHAAWVILDWRRTRDARVFRFAPATVAAVALCVPVMLLGSREAAGQLGWVPAPSLDPAVLGQFAANLFYSVPVAVALLLLAALAWRPGQRDVISSVTAAAAVPLVAVWVVSLGKVSYFFPRYVLFTLIALAILAGIAVVRLGRVWGVATLVAVAALGVYDQAMIREPSAHDWVSYPAGVTVGIDEFAETARVIGGHARPGDGIVYPYEGVWGWEEVDLGVDYYLPRYLGSHVPAPAVLFTAETAAQADARNSVACRVPARCLGSEPRVWVVSYWAAGPLSDMTKAQAALLDRYYMVSHVWHHHAMMVALLLRRL